MAAPKGNQNAQRKPTVIKLERLKEKLADHKAWVDGKAHGIRASFRNTHFIDLDLTGADFSDVKFAGVEFINCILREASFSAARMKNSKMNGCIMGQSDLTIFFVKDCDFSNSYFGLSNAYLAEFERVKFENSSFEESDLLDAAFIDCNLKRDCILDGVENLDRAKIYEQEEPEGGDAQG